MKKRVAKLMALSMAAAMTASLAAGGVAEEGDSWSYPNWDIRG